MNRRELEKAIAARENISVSLSQKILAATIEVIIEEVAEGREVKILNFGTFSTKERASRVGRNIVTGKEVYIPHTVKPVFTPGGSFVTAVKNRRTNGGVVE